MPPLGAHMSIAGGYYKAVDLAHAAGCDCVQVFTKNQQQWKCSPLDPGMGRHLPEDRVCRLAREAVKLGGGAHVANYAGPEIAAAVVKELPAVRAKWPGIDRALSTAALSPIKGAGAARNLPPQPAVRRCVGAAV